VKDPERAAFRQVAKEFVVACGRPVKLKTIPRSRIESVFQDLGFLHEASACYTRMTEATIDGVELPDHPNRGSITVRQYIQRLVKAGAQSLPTITISNETA
jgi:hypothetical protein